MPTTNEMSAQKKTCLFLCVTSLKNFSRVHNCKIFFIVTSYVCCVLSSRFLKVLKCLHIHVELMKKKWLNLSNYFEVHNDSIHVMTKSMKYNIIMILVKSLSLALSFFLSLSFQLFWNHVVYTLLIHSMFFFL